MRKANPDRSVSRLWRQLAQSLHTVFDPHGVCATLAGELASLLDLQTLVAVTNPNQDHLDVWIGLPGETSQQQWPAADRLLSKLMELSDITSIAIEEVADDILSNSPLWPLASRNIVSAPLPYPPRDERTAARGIICLLDPEPDDELCSLLELLTIQASLYFDRALIRRRSAQQEAEFAIISDIGYSLTSTLSLDTIVSQLSGDVRRAMAVESVSIGLVDETGQNIVFDLLSSGGSDADRLQLQIRVGQGIAGLVAAKGEVIISNNARTDRRFSRIIDEATGSITNSVLCVPLIVGENVIGVLRAVNKQNGFFDQNDTRLLQAISSPLAIAIENARLHTGAVAEKRRIELIFASMSEGLLTADRDVKITSTNDAFLRLMGYEKSDVLGRPVVDVLATSKDQFESFIVEVERLTSSFSQLHCRIGTSSGDGIPVLIGGTILRQEIKASKEFIFVISDLRQLMEIERMRDDFFHNIVHELRTPLASILLYARLLREGNAREDRLKAERFLATIERESDRLQKMVRQMLQLAKLESQTEFNVSARVTLNPVIDQIVQLFADQASEKGLIFETQIDHDLPPIRGNEETLYVVVKNLVENSVKFTSSGRIVLSASVEGNYVRIDIEDEGIGIPAEAMPHLFQRFYRAQAAVEKGIAGSGLGLYMVKETVERLSGQIMVDSTLGKGSKFTIFLPRVSEDIANLQ